MMIEFFSKLRMGIRRTAFVAALCLMGVPAVAPAQVLTQQQGAALQVDLLAMARNLSMRDVYARSLYAHIRANPTVMQNPNFYVNFLIYLMMQDPEFNCQQAFASEFERRDFFTQSFNLQAELAQTINSVTIPDRFDVAYVVSTGEYDFAGSSLPLTQFQAIMPQPLSGSITAIGANTRLQGDSCARQMLTGTNVETAQFPWRFNLINEAGERRGQQFPFSGALTLPAADARQLFERFGRQLYAIVSYQVRAANDASRKIQVIATDGQLFGLSSDAVVRVKSFAHPTMSQPSYLDVSNPLDLELGELGMTMSLSFQQQGFRAVGSGTRLGNGTDFSAAVSLPVNGSGAVGSSGFIFRLSSPQMLTDTNNLHGLRPLPGAERYLTVYGNVDFERITAAEAPVSGVVVVQQVNAAGELEGSYPLPFAGLFRAGPAPEAPPAPTQPEPQLDELAIENKGNAAAPALEAPQEPAPAAEAPADVTPAEGVEAVATQ